MIGIGIGTRLTLTDPPLTGEVVAYRQLVGGSYVVTLAHGEGQVSTHAITPEAGDGTGDGAPVRISTAPSSAEARRLAEVVLSGRSIGSVSRALRTLALAVLAHDRPAPAPAPAPAPVPPATREMAEAQGLLARLAAYPDRLAAITRTLRVLVEM